MSTNNYINISSQALLSSPGFLNKGRKLFRHSILDFISTLNKKVDNKFLRGAPNGRASTINLGIRSSF